MYQFIFDWLSDNDFISIKTSGSTGNEKWLEVARPYQLDTRMVTAEEVRAMVKGHSAKWVGGMHTASDGRGEPFTAVPAVANWLHQNSNVLIRENCAARCLNIEAGQVRGVWTAAYRFASPKKDARSTT